MKLSPKKINLFLLAKLPSAWLCGVRLQDFSEKKSVVSVRYRWINQNPFGSMYFAVQAMAAELTTGALVMAAIKKQDVNISMLVARQAGSFSKKAIGKITFTCQDGQKITEYIQKAIETGEGQLCVMNAVGKNEHGEEVSRFSFEWTVKVK